MVTQVTLQPLLPVLHHLWNSIQYFTIIHFKR
jgi:hypothetical protein